MTEIKNYYISAKYPDNKYHWTAVLLTEDQANEYESKGYAVCKEKPKEG